jgi:arylsulfatase A-like enzyme
MDRTYLLLSAVIFSLCFILSCTNQTPTKERQKAKEMLQSAFVHAKEAPVYTRYAYTQAQRTLSEADKKIEKNQFVEARKLLSRSLEEARLSIIITQTGKAIRLARPHINDPSVKELKQRNTEIVNLHQLQKETQSAFIAQDYNRAQQKAEQALNTARELLTLMSQKLSESGQEPLGINFFLYGKSDAKKQEFTYHAGDLSQKTVEKSLPDKPNIILISLDTLRAQSMSCYGFTKETTPFMDQLAREGVLFENMCSASTTTPPSHMSMMTGLYRSVHGVFNSQVLDQNITTLPEVLSNKGYATCAVTEDGFLVRDMGFGRGFDDYYEIKDITLFNKLLVAGGFAKDVFEKGKSWIAAKNNQKFFLFLHTYEVHAPYFPPPPYDTMFLDNPQKHSENLNKFRTYKGRLDAHKFPPEFIRAQYEGEARYTDDLIKDFIGFINDRGLAAKTLVIITSDHGEELFEHRDIVGHGRYTYDTESHIPFIMWMPEKLPSGKRVKSQVSNVDIFPTIIDFLKLDVTGKTQGQSLLPLLHDPMFYGERQVFCEANEDTCVRSLNYKFIDSHELYLYDTDPHEQFNRAEEQKDLCDAATQELNKFRNECQLLKIQKSIPEKSLTVPLSEKDIMKLQALGYIGVAEQALENGNDSVGAASPGPVYLWLEAEDADTIISPLEVASGEDASKGYYLHTPNGTGNHYTPAPVMATYSVTVSQPDIYIMWGQVMVTDRRDNSFFMQVDDGPDFLWEIEPGKNWHWDKINDHTNKLDPVMFYLTSGIHTIKIKMREDGTKLDRMLLTNDQTFIPRDKEEIGNN